MSASFRSDSVKAEKLDDDNFVAFAHAAAGHDGVRCSTSGSLIAKPCTQQEVDFYESSAFHPEFAKYMPGFIGTLTAAPQELSGLDSTSAQAATKLHSPSEGALSTPSSSTADTPIAPELDSSSDQVPLPQSLATGSTKAWVPSGGRKLDTNLSIVLENVAAGFTRPNVIDVKLGSRLWADDAVPDKRAKLDQVAKETTSGSLGFRIAGMKLWVGEDEVKKQAEESLAEQEASSDGTASSKMKVIETDGYRHYDKWYGRAFKDHNVKEGFETFLAGAKAGKIDRSKLVASRLANELRSIQSMLEAEESRMYSASVLFVYEADPDAFEHALAEETKQAAKQKDSPSDSDDETVTVPISNTQVKGAGELVLEEQPELELGAETVDLEEEDDEVPPKVFDIRLIDFAHASWTPGQGPDENVLKGIRNLARIMEELAAE
ncbi:hypothetical protein VTO42DRAFT_2061 [Malbranchea cinnamomea]